MKRPVIYCVDDEPLILERLVKRIHQLLGREFDVEGATDPLRALDAIDQMTSEGVALAVVITDQQLSAAINGDTLLIKLHERYPDALKILSAEQLSVHAVRNVINNAKLYRYVIKPWEEKDMVLTIAEAARSFLQKQQILQYTLLLHKLNEATQKLSGVIDEKSLINLLLSAVLDNTNAEKGFILLQKDDGLRLANVSAVIQEDEDQLRARAQDPAFLDALERQAFYLCTDAQDRPPYQLAAPIRHKGRDLGYILIENDLSLEPFSDNHHSVLNMLAAQAAISLDNASLYAYLEKRKAEVEAEVLRVNTLRTLAEEKSRDLNDSLRYARRMQLTMLPEEAHLQAIFPQSFVLFSPRESVSGHSYWWTETDGYFVLACVESEVAGVQGAFTALLSANLLGQIIAHDVYSPHEVLLQLNRRLFVALMQDLTVMHKGIKISIICFNRMTRVLSFSGVGASMMLLRGGQFMMLEGMAGAIGSQISTNEQYPVQTITVTEGDLLCCYTSGMINQLHGTTGQPFTLERLSKLLLPLSDPYYTEDPKTFVRQALADWQGTAVQTEDAILIGVRF